MKSWSLVVALTVSLVAGAAAANASGNCHAPLTEDDVGTAWLNRPSADVLVRDETEKAKLKGARIVLECRVGLKGELHQCRAVANRSGLSDYKKVAVGLGKYFRLPASLKGCPTSGRRISVPMNFGGA